MSTSFPVRVHSRPTRRPAFLPKSVLAALLALSTLAPAAMAAPVPAAVPAATTVQRTAPPAGAEQRERTSAHFVFRYDPARLDAETVEAAVAAAEEGYARCAEVFPVGRLSRRVAIDLTPNFTGATGYAYPERHVIAIRVPDLDYLGLDLRYVMTHEVAHVFTYAELASRGAAKGTTTGPWGEGLADFATGRFGDVPLADWWGRALHSGGLWCEPDWLISGASSPSERDFVRERTATYAQPALLIRHLAETEGSDTFFRFYADYSSAVARQAAGRRRERRRQTAEERVGLDALFRRHFGAGGEEILAEWQKRLAAAEAPSEPALRLALHQHIYGSIREFETQHARDTRRGDADEAKAGRVREEFRLANRSLRGGDPNAAAAHLARARRLFSPPRHPDAIITAWAPWGMGTTGLRDYGTTGP